MNVTVQPQLLRWARERASLSPADLARRLQLKEERITRWEATGELPLAHLERLADKTHTPVGYLFLPAPPVEKLPIPDFRTVDGQAVRQPSPNLLDTIYDCQRRQGWFRDYLIAEGEEHLAFVGSASVADSPAPVARRIRETLGWDDDARAAVTTHDAALSALVARAEAARILVMRSSVVGNNTHRKLDIDEFRGFALCDEYAPLIFINAADWVAARIFTLVHELSHLWLGESGVSDVRLRSAQESEQFCNAVAAEVLVPRDEFQAAWDRGGEPAEQARRLARRFKVSMPVLLLRARDAGLLSNDEFGRLFAAERSLPREKPAGGGGDFYRTQSSRLGKRFALAVIGSALEGRTPYTEAFQLLGIRKGETFDQFARSLGVIH